jgi:hypothetical protein
MLRFVSIGILFLAVFGVGMAIMGASQPGMTAKHTFLVSVGASAFAGYVTFVLASRWATFRNFTNDPWHWF